MTKYEFLCRCGNFLLIFLWKILPNFPDLAGGIFVDNSKQPIFLGLSTVCGEFFSHENFKTGTSLFHIFPNIPQDELWNGKSGKYFSTACG